MWEKATQVGYQTPGTGTGTPHTSQTWLQSPVPPSLLSGIDLPSEMGSSEFIPPDYFRSPWGCKHKIWQAKPAVIYLSLSLILSGETIQWFHINTASSELMNTETKALPGQVHSFGRVTARTDVLSCEIIGSVWFDQWVAFLSGGLAVKGAIWHQNRKTLPKGICCSLFFS